MIDRTGAQNGDLVFFGADKAKVVNEALGALRAKVGHEKGHVDGRTWAPLWVVDFPMFEQDEENNRWAALHHPFTSPKDDHEDLLTTDPGACLSKAYDMVLNGWEVGGGSVRIHSQVVQSKVFDALKISAPRRRSEKFGFLLEALQYGAPPARRLGLRPGSPGHADGRRRIHPRRDRLPQDPARAVPDDQGTERSRRETVAGTAYPGKAAEPKLSKLHEGEVQGYSVRSY